ncbi:hypothetical protein NPX13_g5035 [Xylaria arbuscula]|uniref:DUF6536 domain-containing protein n=1 Tax=Xylaria arbuscula TaxID=114810 RepID=A0A9W8NER2_9PEZI|nr:hypothetical protein NPX13_g5035 [Xylaria arbuscula]
MAKLNHRLASTNFFMQILNAPTREEIDAAHLEGKWLEIGVSSARNLFKISKFRSYCWLGLLISSIPIHLLSNSTVFTTEHRERTYHLTIATEEFLNGGVFFPPGASLLTSEVQTYGQLPGFYGTVGTAENYTDRESTLYKYISSSADLAKTWDRINVPDCMQYYLYNANSLDRYRNLILVVDHPGGWLRNEMWQDLQSGHDVFGYNASYWDRLVPANVSNHLFFDTSCEISVGEYIGGFFTDCAYSLGIDFINTEESVTNVNPFTFFKHFDFNIDGKNLTVPERGSDTILIKYCLSEPINSICYVGLSTALLFAVTLSVIIKSSIALVVTAGILRHYRQSPLVTIGDSIASFIEKPDKNSDAWSIVDIRKNWIYVGPKKWRVSSKRRWLAIPTSIWISSYLLFAITIATGIYFLYTYGFGGGECLAGCFASSHNANMFIGHAFPLVSSILIASSPQLLLSASYLAYNGLFTRLQVAREWSLFGTGFYPLRVTDPQGNQIATYRLQLPYKYSLPLIAVSASLHFLVSNTLYIVVSTGGYLKYYYDIVNLPGLPADSVVVVGFSPIYLLVVLIVSSILITIPIIFGFKKLPSNMIVVGANSLAISAACHASCLSHAMLDTFTQNNDTDNGETISRDTRERVMEVRQRNSSEYAEQTDMESVSMLYDHSTEPVAGNSMDSTDSVDVLGRIARSRVRWGVVEMPPEWYRILLRDEQVGHLSFGVEKDEVVPPEPGRWYL